MLEETTKIDTIQFHKLIRALESISKSLDKIGKELSEIKERMR
jgi:hypothetical protein